MFPFASNSGYTGIISLFWNWFLLEVTVGGIRAVQGHFLLADSDVPLFQNWLRLEVTVGGIRAIQGHFQNADSGFFFVLDLTSFGGNCRWYPHSSGTFPGSRFRIFIHFGIAFWR